MTKESRGWRGRRLRCRVPTARRPVLRSSPYSEYGYSERRVRTTTPLAALDTPGDQIESETHSDKTQNVSFLIFGASTCVIFTRHHTESGSFCNGQHPASSGRCVVKVAVLLLRLRTAVDHHSMSGCRPAAKTCTNTHWKTLSCRVVAVD